MLALLFYLLRLRRYKAKCVKTRCLQEWVGHLEPKYFAIILTVFLLPQNCLQCFDTVGWAPGGKKGIRPVKNGGGGGGHWLARMEWLLPDSQCVYLC